MNDTRKQQQLLGYGSRGRFPRGRFPRGRFSRVTK